MHESEVKNIVHKELIEHDERIQAIGCPTLVGCGKTALIETYINGKLKSDINDINTGHKSNKEAIEAVAKDVHIIKEALKYDSRDIETRLKEAKSLVERGERIQRENRLAIWGLVLITLTVGVGKIYQDKVNQDQTVSYLNKLTTAITILQEHDKLFQDHMQQSKTEKNRVVN